MTDTLRTDPFSSVYVLDAHFQQQNTAAINVFNSAAGRAIASEPPPTDKKSPVFKPNRRQGADVSKLLLNNDSYNPSRFDNGNIVAKNNNCAERIWIFEEDECRGRVKSASTNYQDCRREEDDSFVAQTRLDADNFISDRAYLDEETVERQSFDAATDENRNITPKGRLTRRLVRDENPASSDVCITIYEDEKLVADDGDDARIDEKILRLKSHYEKGFVADEKCDILKRMLTGFLSGIIFAKNSSRTSKWRKRKSSDDLYREASYVLGIPCEMTDSCRCLDCQCNYFDCGDSSSVSSDMSVNVLSEEVAESECEAEAEAEAACSGGAATPAPADEPEMAAGTPVLLDHLLNTPLSCALQ